MRNDYREAKQKLRYQVRAALRQIPAQQRATASTQARALLKAQAQWRAAQSILFFASLPEELDVWPLLAEALAAGKRVALPRFVAAAQGYEACQVLDPEADLELGQFGIREPRGGCVRFPPDRLDLILVPGVAFDLQGGRLGRGKGYYDQLLGGLRGSKCGVAFDQQVVGEVPLAPHDICLDYILTPNRWVEIKASKGTPRGRE
jgi:5-formyltetrahydrofolate cyclo-ligase